MSDREGKNKTTFFAAQRLLSTKELNGWKLYPAVPGWKDSHTEKQTSKAWTGKEVDGGRRYRHHHFKNLEEQSVFIEFVVANRFADLKKKLSKQKTQKIPTSNKTK